MGRRTGHRIFEVDGIMIAEVPQTITGDESGATPGQPLAPGSGGSGGGAGAPGPLGVLPAARPGRLLHPTWLPHRGPARESPGSLLNVAFRSREEGLRQGVSFRRVPGDEFNAAEVTPLEDGPFFGKAVGPKTVASQSMMIPLDGVLPIGDWTLKMIVTMAEGQTMPTTETKIAFTTGKMIQFFELTLQQAGVGCTFAGNTGYLLPGATGAIPALEEGERVVVYLRSKANAIQTGFVLEDGTHAIGSATPSFQAGYTPPSAPWSGYLQILGKDDDLCTPFLISDQEVLPYAADFGAIGSSFMPSIQFGPSYPSSEASPDLIGGVLPQVDPADLELIRDSIDGAGLIRDEPMTGPAGIIVTSNGSGGYDIDFSQVDAYTQPWYDRGFKAVVTLSYVPPVLQTGGNPQAPPTSAAALADIQSRLIAHYKTKFPGYIEALTFWNEPTDYFAGDTPAFVSLYAVCQAKLHTDHPDLPLGAADAYASDSKWQAALTYAADNDLVVGPATIHDYTETLGETGKEIRDTIALYTTRGLPTPVIYATEWNWSLNYWAGQDASQEQGGTDYIFDRATNSFMPAFAFARMAEFLRYGVKGATFTRLGQASFVPGERHLTMFGAEDDGPHPLPVLAAFQVIWALKGARFTVLSGHPAIHAIGTTDDDGIIRIGYGAYRAWNREGRITCHLGANGLPDEYTWARYAADDSTAADSRLQLVAAGDQDNLPVGFDMQAQSVGMLVITPA